MDTSSDKQQEQRLGHRRQPALGKAMPVTALLLNLNLAQSNRPSHARSAPAGALDEDEPPPRYFSIAEELQQPPSPSENKAAEPALLGAGKPDVPCLNCCQRAPLELSGPGLAINEMCQRLCSDECRRGLSLTGCLATQDAEQLRQDFLKQYEIAEALAKTSAMTSTTQMKQRLAARKLEMDIETQAAAASTEPAWLTTPSDKAATTTAAAAAGVVVAAAAAGDTLPPIADNEQPPPRDLLLYLVRMGSFNSAPKINNVDSQDDGLELPKGLSTDALLDHVRQLHGSGVVKPSLLSRCFLKPPLNSDDVTDGLRCLQLNSVSRVCSAPSDGAQHIRLLQWNILSQTLGQHNDGFVRCPDEALTWQHRRYLIVQEILQNQPDVVCLKWIISSFCRLCWAARTMTASSFPSRTRPACT
ncbi:uncharacterized protein Dmoj_GI25727, isoform E [Drosophila mojavensis]|uniref:Uncharacterized protein, isoform E n=1 Tax=Drosophila mojavensis TaxID=7230 RepID=A0A0Q9X177_DROMO|nr:uncharacterized protein Dmoj_GI25727, isoform E [Drosophila mojavensis]